jgi:hypothetical protein
MSILQIRLRPECLKTVIANLPDTAPTIVAIPARNEEQLFPALLEALCALDVQGGRLIVCIYLDSCSDGSETLLRQAAGRLPFELVIASSPTQHAENAGAARRAAMAMALSVLGDAEGLLFTTDADSRPRHDWIRAGYAALVQADAVAGRIVRRNGSADPAQCRIETYYDRLYRYRRLLDPIPWEARDTHHFTGGANMAFRASAYRALGGFPALPSGEDATILDEAARAGLRVRRDAAMVVETSSRRIGRAASGLASTLLALDSGLPPHVAHPGGAAWQWQAHAAARAAFATIGSPDVRKSLAARLDLTADHVLGVARDCPNAEAFAIRIVPAAPAGFGVVSLAAAEEALSALETGASEIAA